MNRAFFLFALALPAAAALSGCNSAPAPAPAPTVPQNGRPPITPSDFKLPEGSGCAGAVARDRAVIDNDHSTGNVNDSVFKQISGEIDRADSACAAGRQGEAMSLISASKSRHGYPG